MARLIYRRGGRQVDMGSKTPRKAESKKPSKSVKQKREAKRAKEQQRRGLPS
jgi:hypothetical protein